jgi:hypothetical protein
VFSSKGKNYASPETGFISYGEIDCWVHNQEKQGLMTLYFKNFDNYINLCKYMDNIGNENNNNENNNNNNNNETNNENKILLNDVLLIALSIIFLIEIIKIIC